jgi:hypothetical protein
MTDFVRSFSGRKFSADDIEKIKWARKTYPQLSRNELCHTICEIIEWTTPTGTAKAKPCWEFLAILEQEGLISLPPTRTVPVKREKKLVEIEVNATEINCKLSQLKPVRLEIAYAGERLKQWRAYVDKYHMLGDKQAFGSRLHYFVMSGDRELGCLQFSASAWALAQREEWIGWDLEARKQRLNLIINNSRFLIFPWVKVKYLASHVLGLIAKQIEEDWLREYCYAPVLIETFVDLEYFKGTCYKASNWIYIGETKGRGRMDREKKYELSRKAIFMYPLQKDFREYLKGEKPYKKVNPDE